MDAIQWIPVAGAAQAMLLPLLNKPDITNSNAYLISTPAWLAMIDAGGAARQAEFLSARLREEYHRQPRPVRLFFSHAHVDHILGFLQAPALCTVPEAQVMLHPVGAQIITRGDARLSQAELFGRELPRYAGAYRLLQFDAGHLARVDDLEIMEVPGHSPDSLCFRLGKTCFTGDLLFAAEPLIAGILGWSRPELMDSLDRASKWFAAHEVEACYPGHGAMLTGAVAREVLRRSRGEVARLENIGVMDAPQIRTISQHALELFEELGLVTGLLQARLERLATQMHNLEEMGAAREIRGILDSARVASLLEGFRLFRDGLASGAFVDAHVALKGVQVARRLWQAMDYDRLQVVLDPSLVRFLRCMLEDFLTAAQGLRWEPQCHETDLAALVQDLVQEVRRRPAGGLSMEDVPDDEAGFRAYLIRSLTCLPLFDNVAIEVQGDAAPQPVQVDPLRLHDTLRRLLEDLVSNKAQRLELVMSKVAGPAMRLELRVDGGHGLSALQQRLYQRRFAFAGATWEPAGDNASLYLRCLCPSP